MDECRIMVSVPNIAIQYTLDPTSKRNNEKGRIDRNKAGNIDVTTLHFKNMIHIVDML